MQNDKRIFWFALMTSVLAVSFWILQSRNGLTLENVQFQHGSRQNLGTVPHNVIIRRTLFLHNPNKFAVDVSIPAEGCICTSVAPRNTTIPPQGLIPLAFEIEPEGKGENTQAIRVLTKYHSQIQESWLYVTYFRPKKSPNL